MTCKLTSCSTADYECTVDKKANQKSFQLQLSEWFIILRPAREASPPITAAILSEAVKFINRLVWPHPLQLALIHKVLWARGSVAHM